LSDLNINVNNNNQSINIINNKDSIIQNSNNLPSHNVTINNENDVKMTKRDSDLKTKKNNFMNNDL
jgi:hypothetical protein